MQRLTCQSCGHSWVIDDGDLRLQKVCPFCNCSIQERVKFDAYDTLGKAIYGAIVEKGLDVLLNLTQLSAFIQDMLQDTTEDLVKEKRVFSRIITERIINQNNYASIIRKAFDKEMEEAIKVMDGLRYLLVEEEGVSDSWADIICDGFSWSVKYWNGIGTTQIFNVDIDDGFLLQKKSINPLGGDEEVMPETDDSQPQIIDEWIKKAEQGDAIAQSQLAFSYYNGKELAQDYGLAFSWGKKAAEQGEPHAQNLVGVILEDGLGVLQEPSEAVKWYKLAADQGYSIAQYNLGRCFNQGIGLKKDVDRAAYWMKKASEQGYDCAQYLYGLYYESGDGVPQNFKMAAECLLKSALQGNSYAKEELIKLCGCLDN